MNAVMEVNPVNDTRTGETTRVTVREVRERVFRTLRTMGAGGSQARTVTEQVVFAELHRGTGLAELLDALPGQPWAPVSMTRPNPAAHRPVEYADAVRPLQHATAMVDLVAAEPQLSVVVRAGLTAFSSLLDEPLSRSARIIGCYLNAWEHTPQGGWLRTAAPDGSVGTGAVGAGGVTAVPVETLSLGAVVLHTTEEPPSGGLHWLGAEQQRTRQTRAIVEGILVDAAVWQRLGGVAQNFLVAGA